MSQTGRGGGLPSLPPRGRSAAGRQVPPSSSRPDDAMTASGREVLGQMATQVASNPGIQRLLANPDLLQSAVDMDPTLRTLLQSNPHLAGLLSGEKLQNMMQLLRDPASLMQPGNSQGLLPSDTDMSLNRRTLLELQQYSQNLHRRTLQDPPAGGVQGAGMPGSGVVGGMPMLTGAALEQRLKSSTERLGQLMQARGMQAGGGGKTAAASTAPAAAAAGSSSGWQGQQAQFYSPAAAFASQQQQQQQQQEQPVAGSAAAATPVRAMHAPLQHEPLYSGLHDHDSHSGSAYQGSYTFSHSEKEVPLQALPQHVQAHILSQLNSEQLQGAGQQATHVHGPGCSHDHANHSTNAHDHTHQHGPACSHGSQHAHPGSHAHGFGSTHGSTHESQHGHVHGPGCSHGSGHGAPGSEAAQKLYAHLYQQYEERMRVYEAAEGKPELLGIEKPDPGPMWAAYYHAYPPAGQQGLGRGTGAAQYYEAVEPSDWKPDKPEDCWELYRRAHCGKADAVWPPVWVLLCYIASVYLPFVPFLLLGAALAFLFLCGMAFCAIVLAGIPSKELATSRTIASFIASLELTTWAVAVCWILPSYTPRWGLGSLVLGASLTALPLLHLTCYLTNPGYVEAPPATSPTTDNTSRKATNKEDDITSKQPGRNEDSWSSGNLGLGYEEGAANEQLPLLAGRQGGTAGFNTCITCKVPRPLRSKHCPLCDRCVDRLDHHCPAIYNCVGAGNHRQFAAYMICMVIAQASWLSIGFSFIEQLYQHASSVQTTSLEEEGVWCSLAAVTWAAGAQRGLLLLLIVQVPLLCAGLILVTRLMFGVAANLTTNEIINRKRYTYLNHEVAGYSNRFDHGAVHNCIQFWTDPHQDWWTLFEEGDREMESRRVTLLNPWSPGILLRLMDVAAVRYREHMRRLKEARLAKQLQEQAGGTLDAGQLKQLVAAAAVHKADV